jgi:DNA-binding MarR family transcriptional regulator
MEDERTVNVSLTTKGGKLKNKAEEIPIKIQNIFRTDDFNESNLILFQNSLKKLINILQKQNEQ